MKPAQPHFFIVGAPKCGTTAMNDYLAQHPDIFMTNKEQHFFGKDLGYRIPRTSLQKYTDSFSGSDNKKIKGESSVWYLFSKTAANEIKEFSAEAKILIMLRNPADMIYSLHSQNIYDCNEEILSFENALLLESDRKKGINIAASCTFTDCLLYTEAGMYFEQVKRYINTFGRENVIVILYDDFKKNIPGEYKKVLRFLSADDTFTPEISVVNANKKLRNNGLHKLIKNPTERQRKFVRRLLPFKSLRSKAIDFIYNKNIAEEKRKTMDPNTRARLLSLFKDDIRKLSSLIERDLTHWQQ